MAVNEQIVTGRKFRKLVDEATKLWQRISFWTKASDVEFDDGSTAETKMGAINGITDSLASTSSNIAASAKALSQLNNKLAHGRVELVVNEDGTLGYKLDGADTVTPFSSGTYRVTLGGTLSLHNSAVGYAYNTGINVYADVTIRGNKISYTGFSASDLSTRSGQINALGVDWGYNTQLSAKIRGLGIANIAKI